MRFPLGWVHARQKSSGEGALLAECDPPEIEFIVAQFDNHSHEHASGWTRYRLDEFDVDEDFLE